MKNKKIGLLSILLLSFVISSTCFAWGQLGHRLVGEIAFQQLHPAVKKVVLNKLHVLDPYYGHTSFSYAATLADRLKSHDVDAFNEWHFINQGFSVDGTAIPPYDKQNLVWATHQSIKTLDSPRSNELEKAYFLQFLMHFVGDIHQPLHCSTRISKAHPMGDGGGNGYPIQYEKHTNLHELWDSGVGLFDEDSKKFRFNAKDIKRYADRLQEKYPAARLASEIKQTDPMVWANESFELAKTQVYGVKENATPSMDYIKKGQLIAEKRLVLAGYRLACILNSMIERDAPCLKFSSPAPEKLGH